MTGDELERIDIRRTIDRIYNTAAGGAGCCLHVVVEDGNYDDSAVEVCIRDAQATGHIMCQTVADFLRRLTRDERRAFLRVRRSRSS